MNHTKILSITALLFVTFATWAQTPIASSIAASKVTINGTSSLHDWEENVTKFDVKATLHDAYIKDLVATFDSKSIESGKSIMDDKTYDALQADKYPQIILKASALKITGSTVSGKGTLTIAGKEKTIDFSAKILESTASYLTVSGATDVVMSEYGIDPPTAMFGTMVTGDKVTINYKIKFNK